MALSTLSRWDSHPGTSPPQRLDFDPNMAIFWTIAAPDRYPETTPHVSRVFGCARLKLLTNVVKSPICKCISLELENTHIELGEIHIELGEKHTLNWEKSTHAPNTR